jgi:hypothetical protein
MLEDRIRHSIESALTDLRTRLDAGVHEAVTEFLTARNEAQDAAVAEARAQALEEAVAVRDRLIAEAEARVRASLDESIAGAREEERQRVSADVRAAVEAEAAVRLDAALAAERQVLAQELADAASRAEQSGREAMTAASVREREHALAGVSRLLEGIRQIDAAGSLSDLLDALTDAAARETARAAVLVVRGGRVQGWRVRGFGAQDDQPRSVDMAPDEAGVIGRAISAVRTVTTAEGPGAEGPPFATLPPDRTGLAVPVVVGGRVVAVVYADGVGSDEGDANVPNSWPELVEVLARHAGRCLETITIQRVVQAPTARGDQAAVGQAT